MGLQSGLEIQDKGPKQGKNRVLVAHKKGWCPPFFEST